MIVLPMSIAGMIASLCHLVVGRDGPQSPRPSTPRLRNTNRRQNQNHRTISSASSSRIFTDMPSSYRRFHWIRTMTKRIQSCCFMCGLHHTSTMIFVFIYVPLLVYTCMSLSQKIPLTSTSWQSSHRNSIFSEVGNTFGIVALFGMSFLLIPVTKYSFLLQYFTNTQQLGIQQRIHQALGSCIMISVLFHVVFHLYRWYVVQNYNNVLSMLFIIPSTCWKKSSWTDHSEQMLLVLCSQQDSNITATAITSDCTCYGRVRNVMGCGASIALLIISMTTVIVPSFRRCYYKMFYILHRVLGPIVFLLVILHWNRSIVYLSGNILYYLAGTVPIWIANRMKLQPRAPQPSNASNRKVNCDDMDEHVRITLIERIASCHGNDEIPLLALTFETTKDVIDELYYHPGQYVKLFVPSISIVSHPFTINQVCSNTNTVNDTEDTPSTSVHQLRILFRCVGPFTKQLARALLLPDHPSSSGLPKIYVDGFYGPSNRLTNIIHDHDHVVIVAGGIGITPYLSLLQNIVQESLHHHGSNQDRFRLKKITFYWACRDLKLIEYIQREYFEPIVILLQDSRIGSRSHLDLRIHIHQTHQDQGNDHGTAHCNKSIMKIPNNVSYTNLQQEQTDEEGDMNSNVPLHSRDSSGIPFVPSQFFPGPRTTIRSNFVSCMIYICIVWIGLWIIWYIYTRYQTKDTILPRIIAPLAILAHAYVVSRGMYWLVTESLMSCHRRWLRGGYNYYRKDSNDEYIDATLEESNNRAVCPSPTSIEELTKSSSVEMSLVHDNRLHPSPWNEQNADRSLRNIANASNGYDADAETGVMEMYVGRPTVHQILRPLSKNCHRPGLYVCGPSTMMQDIRNAINERCSRQCRLNPPPSITLYEETFEI